MARAFLAAAVIEIAMAFLAPLFLAGLVAVALPVLLHLRKNRPQQTLAFSSLMFLEASPRMER